MLPGHITLPGLDPTLAVVGRWCIENNNNLLVNRIVLLFKKFLYDNRSNCPRPWQRVEPGLRWFKPGQLCTNVKPGQPLVNQGSEAIKPPLDDNVRFRPNAQSTRTRSILSQPRQEAEDICALVA